MYLNDLYKKNPDVIGHEARYELFNSPSVMFLLSRGKNATDQWSLENPFDEKQNDTADILVVKDNFYEIIDIKTRNISKSAQPPNIISAYKLAQVCAKMLDNNEFDKFSINYFEIAIGDMREAISNKVERDEDYLNYKKEYYRHNK